MGASESKPETPWRKRESSPEGSPDGSEPQINVTIVTKGYKNNEKRTPRSTSSGLSQEWKLISDKPKGGSGQSDQTSMTWKLHSKSEADATTSISSSQYRGTGGGTSSSGFGSRSTPSNYSSELASSGLKFDSHHRPSVSNPPTAPPASSVGIKEVEEASICGSAVSAKSYVQAKASHGGPSSVSFGRNGNSSSSSYNYNQTGSTSTSEMRFSHFSVFQSGVSTAEGTNKSSNVPGPITWTSKHVGGAGNNNYFSIGAGPTAAAPQLDRRPGVPPLKSTPRSRRKTDVKVYTPLNGPVSTEQGQGGRGWRGGYRARGTGEYNQNVNNPRGGYRSAGEYHQNYNNPRGGHQGTGEYQYQNHYKPRGGAGRGRGNFRQRGEGGDDVEGQCEGNREGETNNERGRGRGMSRGRPNRRGGRGGGRGGRGGHSEAPKSINVKGKSSNTVNDLATNRECAICFDDLRSPIYQCHNGHLVCEACEKKIDKCAECREPMPKTKIRNRALEEILESFTKLTT